MSRKVIVVGGVAGGASAAARIRRLDESAVINVYEQGEHVSYSNCGLPYLLSGVIPTADRLVMNTPEDFARRYNISMHTRHRVTEIDRTGKRVLVRDLTGGREFWDSYDTLVLSTGAAARFPFGEADRERLFIVKDVEDIRRLNDYVRHRGVKEFVVAGGGFIGLEVAENLCSAGIRVTLVVSRDQVLPTLDLELAQILHKVLHDRGVEIILNDRLKGLTADGVLLASGRELTTPGAVVAAGVTPETSLAKQAGLELGETGGILVDEHYRSSDPDIFAVGDAIQVQSAVTGGPIRLTQAGPAQKEARIAANAICGLEDSAAPFTASTVLKLFDWTAASTGLNERAARAAGLDCGFSYVIPSDKVGLMPDAHPLFFKLVYERGTGRLLGAQAVGKSGADKRIDVVAALISMGGTLEELKRLDLCYAPSYGTAKDVVNIAALVALNLESGRFRQVPVTRVRELVEQNAYIVDVREEGEFARGHIIGAHNIPLSRIRERSGEIPRDIPVYLHCRTSQRSYYAIMALQGMGFDKLCNISGSFLGLSYYEYFSDIYSGREKILTDYNFN